MPLISALKRQENKQDLGDLKHAEIFGTAIKRVKAADLNLVNLQADRALCVSGLFAISKAHAWPTASDEIGAMAEYLESVFLLTPWTSTQCSKADLMAREDFAEIMLSTSKILRDQYKGNQPLVQEILVQIPRAWFPCRRQSASCENREINSRNFCPRKYNKNWLACRKPWKQMKTSLKQRKKHTSTCY